jgi:hypothetical protein
MISGKWTYRSYRNDTALIGDDAQAALGLIFGEGIFDLRETSEGRITGALGMGTGYALTLDGEEDRDGAGFALIGLGIDGTATQGWRYDYRGVAAFDWPQGIDQKRCLVGTVIRVNAHGPHSPAGVTASFVAVGHPDAPPARTLRSNILSA